MSEPLMIKNPSAVGVMSSNNSLIKLLKDRRMRNEKV